MRLSTILRLAVLATLFGLTAYSLPAQDESFDDVAAAARKARAQQQSAPKPKKVITNDDLPSKKSDAPAPASDAAKAGDQKDAAQAAESDEEKDPKNEAYWRKRSKALHDKLSQSEKELDVLQRELDKGQIQYYSDPQKAMAQEYNRSDINEKTTKIDAKKKEIDGLKEQISNLEDDARKAGADPGWVR